MRVGFGLDLGSEVSGKHKFATRLSKQLQKLGVTIDNSTPDIYLIIPGKKPKKGAINVLRLDGLYLNEPSRNARIMKLIEQSDAIVYQNEFCRDAYERFMGVAGKRYACILNGADPDEFMDRQPADYFLANCKWRPHKRLDAIVSGFQSAKRRGLKSRLIVTGDPTSRVKDSSIEYVGWKKHKRLKRLLAGAVASIHLSWVDWCPNAMVEAIVAGCPVIYSDSGGHPHLATGCGIAINDVQWNFKRCDHDHPRPLDAKVVADAMIELETNKISVLNEQLHIKNVAEKYLSFFERLIK